MKWAPKSNEYCKAFIPAYDKTAELIESEYGNSGQILLAKINCREQRSVCRRFKISSFPTFYLVRYDKKEFEKIIIPETPEEILVFIRRRIQLVENPE